MGLPMKAPLRKCLEEEVSEFHLCSLSVAEIAFKWRRGRLPGVPDPKEWVAESRRSYQVRTPDQLICLRAGGWDWPHGDLVDRIVAAMAVEKGLVLVHTDSALKDLHGFPQRYFPNAPGL